MGDLEYFCVLNGPVEMSDEAFDSIVHFVALLLSLKVQINDYSSFTEVLAFLGVVLITSIRVL